MSNGIKFLVVAAVTFSILAFVFSVLSHFLFPWVLLPASILTGALVLRAK